MEVASEGASTDAESGVDSKAVSKVRRKTRGFLQEMVANISPAFIRYSFHIMLHEQSYYLQNNNR